LTKTAAKSNAVGLHHFRKQRRNDKNGWVQLLFMDVRKKAVEFAVRKILEGGRDLDRIKRQACKRYGLAHMIKNPELLAAFPEGRLTPQLRQLLLKKPTKTISGVTPVAVMIRPQGSCRHRCAYCPSGNLAAKSYTGFEPAALRGRQYKFDPYSQAYNRARQFEEGGHPADKCEVIVMGGTFLQTAPGYRHSFIKGIYDGLNGSRSRTLNQAETRNEKARHRVIGLTIETRPDVCREYIPEMLSYGATRVELGVQHADDAIYRRINRGHRVKDVIDSTRDLKDAAFKVLYHIMPGLPGSNKRKDISFVKKLFSDKRFRPDMLKIYPTLVMEGTLLQRWAENGEFEAYSSEAAADVISEFYRHIPPYVRVMRIQRDIPAQKIHSGVMSSNLRELVEQKVREKGIVPSEIRYREIGMKKNPEQKQNRQKNHQTARAFDSFEIKRLDYGASGGKEFFISSEDEEGTIAGFVRLRFPSKGTMPQIDADTALIRELHVYGSELPIHEKAARRSGTFAQHRGLGSQLLKQAEDIARDGGRERMIVISGVGAREYYRKLGYERLGPYMAKLLR